MNVGYATYRIRLLATSLLIACICVFQNANAQSSDSTYFEFEGDKDDRITIPFELINNLVVVKLSINGSDPLKFIVDSGVRNTLITSLENREVFFQDARPIYLAGLGDGPPHRGYLSENNAVQLGEVTGQNIRVVVLEQDVFRLSLFMGMEVHGLIGYDIFNRFAVEINYQRKVIHLYDPESFQKKFRKLPRHRKWYSIPISIEHHEPYVNVWYQHQKNTELVALKLMVDSGSSSSFSFYEQTHPEIKIPENTIQTHLGTGLSGDITGYLGRVWLVQLGDFNFQKPTTDYPDSASVYRAYGIADRNGSIGGEVLRRFKVIFHYKNEVLLVRKNSDFGEPFDYNVSGISVQTPLADLPLYMVSEVREASAAEQAGVEGGDVIQRINGKKAESLSLNDVLNYLYGKEGRWLTLDLQRDTVFTKVRFRLDDELQLPAQE